MWYPEPQQRRHSLIMGLILAIAFFLQYTFLRPSAGQTCPILFLLPAVVYSGMFLGEWGGAICGVISGIFVDAVSASGQCFHALLFLLLGCIAGLLVHYLLNNTLFTGLLLTFLSTAIYLLLEWVIFYLVPGYGEPGNFLWNHCFQSLFWTTIFSLPFYLFLHRILRGTRSKKHTQDQKGSGHH